MYCNGILCAGEASCDMCELQMTISTQPVLPTDQLRVVRRWVWYEVVSSMFKFDVRCDGCRDTGTDGNDVF